VLIFLPKLTPPLGLWTVCQLRSACRDSCISRYRGHRAGRPRRPSPRTQDVGNGAVVINGNRPVWLTPVRRPTTPSLLRVHVHRHVASNGPEIVFGGINICSVRNKLDDILDVRRDLSLDVVCLVETWHDADSVGLCRRRGDGYQVVNRLRPLTCVDTLATNHGGVAAVATPSIHLIKINRDRRIFLAIMRLPSRQKPCRQTTQFAVRSWNVIVSTLIWNRVKHPNTSVSLVNEHGY